jgi:hypothetical protein
MSLTPRITPVPDGLLKWLHLFARSSFLKELNDVEADEILKQVEEICQRDCQDGQGNWAIMYCRLRFSAVLKE